MNHRLLSLLLAAGGGISSLAFQPAPAPQKAPALFIEGVVKGPDGKPIEGALVLARITNSPDAPDSARTDASGRFKIPARKPSSHLVRVEAKGLAGRTLERVAPGTPLDVVLSKGGVIQGAILDGSSAEPVAGARVEARPQDQSLVLSLPSDPSVGVVQATADAKGRFRLENVASGLHTLNADARGYNRASRSSVPAGGSVELYLFPGVSIVGRIRDAEDTPVAGAVIRAESDAALSFPAGSLTRTEVSSATGEFVVPGLAPATYRLSVRHKDYAPAVMADIVVRPESEATADVVLSPGGRVVGRLVDAEGKPLRGKASVLEVDGKPAPRGLADLLLANADAEGRFQLAAVPPGSHVLAVSAPGHSVTRVEVSVRKGQETDAGEVALEVGLAIRGVVRSKTGAPIPDAIVGTVQTAGVPGFSARTEPDGTFTIAGVTAGRHNVNVSAPGHAQARRSVDAGPDPVEFVLSPAGTIVGTVADLAGRPVESFRASARGAQPTGPNQPFSFQSRTFGAGDGRFSLDVSVEGPHAVEVAAPNHVTATVANVQVVLGQSVDVGRIRLSAGGSVRGMVVDGGGGAIPGATVTVRGAGRDLSGGAGPQGTSDVSGMFTVSGIAPGTVEAVAQHPSFAEGRSGAIDVDPAKGPAEARIVMTRGGRVDGVVRKRDGSGVSGMTVSIWPSQPGMAAGPQLFTTLEDGTFTIEHVRPGRTRLVLMAGNRSFLTNLQDREIDVREGESTSVEFVTRDILLSGRVTRNGEPAPGLRLRLTSATGFQASISMGAPDAGPAAPQQRMMATTGPGGHYEMIATESGKLRMTAASLDSRVSLPTRTVEVPDVDAHVLNVDFAGASVSGVVVDKETGQPIADARISAGLRKPQPGQMGGGSGTSTGDGSFRMELEPGAYRIEARVSGYAPAVIEVDLPASGVSDAKLALSRGAALEGKVVDERGRGVGGLFVSASVPAEPGPPGENRPPTSSGGTQTNGDGTFVIEGLLQQPHVLVARSPNLGSIAVQSGISPGDKDVSLTLKPGGTLQTLVVGPDGAPVQGAFVQIAKFNGLRVVGLAGATTDGRGSAEILVPAGDLEIRAGKATLQGTVQASVTERGAAAVEIKLSEGGPKPRLP